MCPPQGWLEWVEFLTVALFAIFGILVSYGLMCGDIKIVRKWIRS